MKIIIWIIVFLFSMPALSNDVCASVFNNSEKLIQSSDIISIDYRPAKVIISDHSILNVNGKPRFFANGRMSPAGELILNFQLRDTSPGSIVRSVIRGKEAFFTIITYFGSRTRSIKTTWSEGDIYNSYTQSLASGKSYREAAFSTWMGQLAIKYGYTELIVTHHKTDSGRMFVETIFSKPDL